MKTAVIILIILFVALFIYVAILTLVGRNRARKLIIKEAYERFRTLSYAAAGSDDGCHRSAQTVRVCGIEYTEYKDSKGNVLNPDLYEKYIVDGESMQFCGIHNNDLIFSTKGVSHLSEFPVVLVIKKNHITDNCPSFKIRRAWCVANYDDGLVDVARNLLQTEMFQQIRQLDDYDGDTALIKDFIEVRLPAYEKDFVKCENPNEMDKNVVISTTYHTVDNKIRLSIHPLTKVMGKVVASFALTEKQLEM